MIRRLETFLKTRAEVVRVQITAVQGSTPRETDAEMFVAPDALFGTIGGGQLEYIAVERAREMIAVGDTTVEMDVPLGPEIGQCCGGRVGLTFDRLDADAQAAVIAQHAALQANQPAVFICGAGHVGRALAGFFAQLPVRTVLLDSRADELALCNANVECRLTALPEAEVRNAPAGSAFIVLTHDHALDFLLTSEALQRQDAAYVGLIGSKTKRKKFDRFHATQSPSVNASELVCPIGAKGSPDKRPEVIAAFVVAEVMAVLTQLSERACAKAA